MMTRDWPMPAAGILWMIWFVYWMTAALFTNRTKVAEGHWQRTLHVLPLGLGMWLIFHGGRHALVYGRVYDIMWLRAVGVAVTIAGLLFTVWARVHLGKYWSGVITLKEGHRLIRTGPYRWVRHPIYTGFFAGALGAAIAYATGDGFIGAVLVLGALLLKIRREEAVLVGEFGEEYLAFKRDVPALVPIMRLEGNPRCNEPSPSS